MRDTNEYRFGGILLGLSPNKTGRPRDLLDTILLFLELKTDFFGGAGEEKACQILLEKFHKWNRESAKLKQHEVEQRAEAERRHQERLAAKRREEEERIRKLKDEPAICEITDEEAK